MMHRQIYLGRKRTGDLRGSPLPTPAGASKGEPLCGEESPAKAEPQEEKQRSEDNGLTRVWPTFLPDVRETKSGIIVEIILITKKIIKTCI